MSVLDHPRQPRLPKGWQRSVRQFLHYQVILPLLALAALFAFFARFLPAPKDHTTFYNQAALVLVIVAAIGMLGSLLLSRPAEHG